MNKKKIINDPIYGFIHIEHDAVFDCLQTPEFQRLRRIKQLGTTHLVYPGALHTRFHHALGAMHLMQTAIKLLKSKEVEITQKEEEGVLLAILLHDVGHGPFSHTLENTLLDGVHHETISLELMRRINQKLNGSLDIAMKIFENSYPKKFLHQLVSSQLDMDRLDYLRRDSFYTGVSEGLVGIERIIQMLNVVEDELVVEEKGIYSIEKFLMARRFMYWQVYLHKASIASDTLLKSILKRATHLVDQGEKLFASPCLAFFLENEVNRSNFNEEQVMENFILLDDSDIMSAIKTWQSHPDKVLSTLCEMITNRNLLAIKISDAPISESKVEELTLEASQTLDISTEDAGHFVTVGKLSNSAYSSEGQAVRILYKDGKLLDVAEASEAYSAVTLKLPQVRYFYTCLKK